MQNLLSGQLEKMRVTVSGVIENPVQYFFRTQQGEFPLNDLLGRRIRLEYNGEIRCLHCQRLTRKSFNQGYCYPCFQSLARCDRCIVSPELCHFAQGTCREPAWGEQHCMTPHVVYLANSSGLKVGITRGTQIPTRWIDQGAIQALPILQTGSRYLAGLVEVLFKSAVADKTNWRAMLKHEVPLLDLHAERDELLQRFASGLDQLRAEHPDTALSVLTDADVMTFDYPGLSWPTKVNSYNLDATPVIEDELLALKGQYLIMKSGCLNLRKYSAYDVSLFANT